MKSVKYVALFRRVNGCNDKLFPYTETGIWVLNYVDREMHRYRALTVAGHWLLSMRAGILAGSWRPEVGRLRLLVSGLQLGDMARRQ